MLGGTARLAGRQDAPPRAVSAELATERAWWAWRWRGWAPWRLDAAVLVVAALTIVVDVASAWLDLSIGHLGRVPLSPALPLAVLLAARIGASALGCTRSGMRAWRELAVGLGALLATSVVVYSVDLGQPGEAAGLVIGAVGEELVYRLAVLVLVGALAARCAGRDWRRMDRWGNGTGTAALLGGAVVFSALPGHVVQMRGPASIVSFASLAVVLGWVVLRTGAIWPAIVAHAVLNLTTITVFTIDAPSGLRLGLVAGTLIALVVGADVAGRRTGRLRPVPSLIDLTAT
jgi:membrane protease YdiL (CAAX protease family)